MPTFVASSGLLARVVLLLTRSKSLPGLVISIYQSPFICLLLPFEYSCMDIPNTLGQSIIAKLSAQNNSKVPSSSPNLQNIFLPLLAILALLR